MGPHSSHAGSVFNSKAESVAPSSTASTSPNARVSGSPTSTCTPASAANPGIKRRAPIACRRCRRMRSKCIHDKATPPCKACDEAGLGPQDCIFPTRGQPDHDRDYRHPRTRAERPKGASAKRRRLEAAPSRPRPTSSDPWDGLPPLDDLVDGVNRFTRYYFQLGFLPKTHYPDKLRKDHRSCSLFLLLSILSISARMSPPLRERYGTGVKASEFFMERASQLALAEVYAEPELEKCQAFYLLSIAQQGNGLKNKSYINMGIAVRMATLMRLHREETYNLQQYTKTPELIMQAESARRTIWMLYSQDNLHSGPLSPVSLSASDITTLLPCDENDFAQGLEPTSRAALDGTQPAKENPSLISNKNRSLFASLMQIHHLWGIVGRHAVTFSRSPNPWDSSSQFSKMVNTLNEWEASLPERHLFSDKQLQHYKSVGEDLAYLCVTMMTKLCNIVLRRPYLIDVIRRNVKEPRQKMFFSEMAVDLFRNVRELYRQIDAQFTGRTPDESVGAQIASFCIYSCGLFSTYLCKNPAICPDRSIAAEGPVMLKRTIGILNECQEVWPLASRWVDALEKFANNPKSMPLTAEGSMDDGQDPVPRAIRAIPSLILPPISKSAASVAAAAAMPDRALPLPGTQPPSASSTAINSPRNSNFPTSPTPNCHVQNQSNYQFTTQANPPRSPTAHHPSRLNHYHTNHQPAQPQQQYFSPPPHLQFASNQQQMTPSQHHIQAQPPMGAEVPYQAAAAAASSLQHQNLPNIPTGHGDQHPRTVYWPIGTAPAPAPPPFPVNLGRPHDSSADGVGMLICAFGNSAAPPQQHGYMTDPMRAGGPDASSVQEIIVGDGFENELSAYIDGSGSGVTWHPEQWLSHGMFT